MRKISFVVIILIIVSCGLIDNKRDLAELMAEPINLPLHSTIMYQGKDTLINNYFQSDCKMVVFVDSTSCSSCAMNKLYVWHDLVDYAQEKNDKLKIYFIFNTTKSDNFLVSLRNSLLDYPVLLDSLGEFKELNPHLPKNKAMHTFLLDENNNVILVGNPLTNKKIEKMFYAEVEKRLK